MNQNSKTTTAPLLLDEANIFSKIKKTLSKIDFLRLIIVNIFLPTPLSKFEFDTLPNPPLQLIFLAPYLKALAMPLNDYNFLV